MKKELLFLVLGLILNSITTNAQSRFRWEIGYGYTLAGPVKDKFSNGEGRTVYGEFRVKQDDSKFDFGLQASGTIIVREIGFRSCNFMGVSDYNIPFRDEAIRLLSVRGTGQQTFGIDGWNHIRKKTLKR